MRIEIRARRFRAFVDTRNHQKTGGPLALLTAELIAAGIGFTILDSETQRVVGGNPPHSENDRDRYCRWSIDSKTGVDAHDVARLTLSRLGESPEEKRDLKKLINLYSDRAEWKDERG